MFGGPRQAGKTTLARELAARLGARLVSLDDAAALEAVRADPVGFLEAYGQPLCLDEFQRGGEALILALKQRLDQQRTRGQFLLTGSTHFLALAGRSESLAGRVGLATPWTLSQGELERRGPGFLDRCFGAPERLVGYRAQLGRGDYFERIARGGFPEVQDLTERQRERWFESYVETLIARDVAEVAEVRDGHALGQLVRLLAAHSGQELVQKTLADGIGVRPQTVANWPAWLEAIFMDFRLPAWSPKTSQRVIRRPKVHFADNGPCAHLLGRTGSRLAEPTESLGGALLECFVAGELQRQVGWSETRVRLFHLREHRGPEIDLIAEAADGRVVAFEVKATRSRPGSGGEPLVALRERLKAQPSRFVHGFVLYTGEQAFRLDEGVTALPIEALWRSS